MTWFREVESKRGAGLTPSTGKVSKWFHGEWLNDLVTYCAMLVGN